MEEDVRYDLLQKIIHFATLSSFIQSDHRIIADHARDSLSVLVCAGQRRRRSAIQQSVNAVGRCQRHKLQKVLADWRPLFATYFATVP